MSLLDKVKFWKKGEPSFGDINMSAPIGGLQEDRTAGLGGTSDLGGFDQGQEFPESPPSPEGFGLPPPGLSYRPIPPAARHPAAAMPTDTLQKDIEIISSKLDALRATLEAINQRLSSIEREVFERRRGGW